MGRAQSRLSKSKFLSGLQCHKRLWWEVHEPDAPELEPDPSRQFIFEQGTEVGKVARSYVPGGVLIDVPPWKRTQRLQATSEAMKHGARVLYEAAFEHDGVIVLVDILEQGRKGWNLIEVKSSTKVKPQHLPDLAIQTHVVRGAGIKVTRTELMHLNRDCCYPDLSNLFLRQDQTSEVDHLLREVPVQIQLLIDMLRGTLPQVSCGDHCYDPHDCPFLERCWPESPPHAIDSLYRLQAKRQEQFAHRGYRTILDLPPDERLSAIQDRQRRAALGNALIVEPTLASDLNGLAQPLAFLDFETVQPPIPAWNGCRPYDQVPVQLSVHRENPHGKLTHHEWLAQGPNDSREELAHKLLEFTRRARNVLVYNATFERGCIQALQEHLPRLAADLRKLERKLVDLLPIVRNHVYHPGFGGSFSLKEVLPALVPKLSYEGLEISEGAEASQKLFMLLLKSDELKKRERTRLRRELLRYCELDTWALVKLLEKLRELACATSLS